MWGAACYHCCQVVSPMLAIINYPTIMSTVLPLDTPNLEVNFTCHCPTGRGQSGQERKKEHSHCPFQRLTFTLHCCGHKEQIKCPGPMFEKYG